MSATSPPPTRYRSTLTGILWMALAMSLIAVIDGIAKHVVATLNGVQVAWGYFLSMLASLLIYNAWRRANLYQLARSSRPLLQLARAACLVCSLSCLFYGLRYLPLAETTSINFMAPLFVVALAGPVLGERVTWKRWSAVLAGFAGALLVVRPNTAVFQWAAIFPLIGAVFFALFNIVTKQLSASDPPLTTLLYTCAGGTLLLCAALPFVWITPGMTQWFWLLFSGGLGALAHFSILRAFSHTDASLLMPINYIRIIWALGIGFFIFAQFPDTLALAGSLIIVGSGLYVVYSAQ